jgi:uncharacterized phage protein (TIGR02220 family)
MDKGFILLSRNILDSDVFASQKLLKIWVWCLCKANFKDKTIPLKVGKGETIISVKRGSFVFGRHKAEEELFIDGSTIYKSIKKLEEMEMIKINSNNQYSIITINKYDTYQDNKSYKVASKEQPSNNQVTPKEQPSNTTNTLNTLNNDNTIEPINWQSLLDFLNKVLNKKYRSFPEKVKTQYKARLKEGFAKVDIMRAIENASKDEFHISTNYKHLTIEFFSRQDKLDKFSQGENNTSGTTNQKLMTYDN